MGEVRANAMGADSASGVSLSPTAFSGRISRRLGLAVAAFFLLILAVGGLSSFLAWSILSSIQQIRDQSHHIEITETIHATIYQLVREVDRAVIEETLDHQSRIKGLSARAASTLAAFLDAHLREEEPFPEKEREIALIRDIERLYLQLDTAVSRILVRVAARSRARRDDLLVLDTMSHQVPLLAQQLNEIHHAKVRRLMAQGSSHMKVIVGAYVAFLLVGSACVIAGIVLFSQTVASPLRRLASATLAIAGGDFGNRVPIGSRDEIGQLSQSFNDMAGTLQRREAELERAQAELTRRVMETQALYRIGVEISSMLELDKVLHSVVEKARTLLQSQGAALCLLRPEGQGLEIRAVSGPVESSGLAVEGGSPRCLTERGGCFPPGSQPCSICMTLEGAPPGAGLAAPLKRGDNVIGALCVGRKEARPYPQEDRELLEGLAAQAAIAIENARLYGTVRGMAAVEERERIAREMHDGLAQALGFLTLKLALAERMLGGGSPEPARRALAEMRKVAGDAYDEVRQAIFGLRTMVSRGLGLVPTLSEYLHEFSQQAGLQVKLEVSEENGHIRFAPEVEVQLIRIVQEALHNVRKHSRARTARVHIWREGEDVLVAIEDDGIGFDPAAPPKDGPRHFGIATMRERAESVGGTLTIRSAAGVKTQVMLRLPLAAARRGGTG